jgi:hypothetical protein
VVRTVQWRCSRPASGLWPIIGAPTPRRGSSLLWDFGIASLPQTMGGAPGPRWIPGHGQCSGPWSGLQPRVGAPVPRREAGILSVRQAMGGAPVQRWLCGIASVRPASGGFGIASVLRPIVGTLAHRWMPAHRRCSSLLPVPGAWSVLGRIVGARAHDRYSDNTTEDRCPALRSTRPNKGLELTGNKLRSCLAPLVPRSSGLALDLSRHATVGDVIEWM